MNKKTVVKTIAVSKAYPYAISLVAIIMAASLSACGGMSNRDKNTAIGAGVGAAAGAVLTGGGALGTVGGAAVGGVIGNQVGKDKKK